MLALLASSLFFFIPTCAVSIADMAAEVVLQSCDDVVCPAGLVKVFPRDPTAKPTQQTCCMHPRHVARHDEGTGLAAEAATFEQYPPLGPPAPPPCGQSPEQLLNDALNTILALTTSTTVTTTTVAPVPCTTREHKVKESVAKDILEKALKDISKGAGSSAEKANRILEQLGLATTTVTSTETTTTVTTVTTTTVTTTTVTTTSVTMTSVTMTTVTTVRPCAKHSNTDILEALSKLAASLPTPSTTTTTTPCIHTTTPCKAAQSLESSLAKLQAAARSKHVTSAALAVDPTATLSAISTGPTEDLAELPKSSIRRAEAPSP